MGKFIDITGNRYGRLTIIGLDHSDKKQTYWKCKCDCGNECIKRKDYLNDKSSCGCLKKEIAKEQIKENSKKRKIKDLSGKSFGRLKVIEYVKNDKINTYWKCICECGNECIKSREYLKKSPNPSCGCYDKECRAKAQKLAALSKKSHGDTKTKFYRKYSSIKQRCNNPNHHNYDYYGGRGIKLEWNSYEEFKKDMYESYLEHCKKYGEDNTTIDRIDVDGNYCKENCRWATYKEQMLNKRNTIYIEMENGVLIPLKLFCEENNYNYGTLISRYENSKYFGTNIIPYKKLIKDEDIVSTSTEM